VVVVVLLILMLLVIGPVVLAAWARSNAARHMTVWSISSAQHWLATSARFNPGSGETELMRAVCFRHLGQMGRWRDALESSREKGANARRVEQEHELGLIRQGNYEGLEDRMGGSLETGSLPVDVTAAFVHGYLASGEPKKAKRTLDSWIAASPEEPHVAYMWGLYWQYRGDEPKALTQFRAALTGQPDHELALSALAKLLEKQHRLDEALELYVESATRLPSSDTAKVDLARVLRKLARIDEAREVLKAAAATVDQAPRVWEERGWIALESGDHERAERWFAQTPVGHGEERSRVWSAAATAFALEGRATSADRIFAQVDAEAGLSTRSLDLRVGLLIDPNDKEAAEELQRLSVSLKATTVKASLIEVQQANTVRNDSADTPIADSYAQHCSACHGETGEGDGRAARHQFPWPRDFSTGNFQLVSTYNGVPTLEDLQAVITQGMAGTSMRSFENLDEDERKLLSQDILRLSREGIRKRYIQMLEDEEEEIYEEDVQEVVEGRTVPGEIVRVPKIGPADAQAVARGRDVYDKCGCRSCHGDDGTGSQDVYLFDEKRQPSLPRNLVDEPFKGGHEPESIYVRILTGMPGSPHPAARGLTQQELVDLVHYCCSLSEEPKRTLTNHERDLNATSRPYLSSL